jgi:hypothetical protein
MRARGDRKERWRCAPGGRAAQRTLPHPSRDRDDCRRLRRVAT